MNPPETNTKLSRRQDKRILDNLKLKAGEDLVTDFTPMQCRILEGCLAGHKYSEIAARQQIKLSYVKATMSVLYRYWKVQDWGNPHVRLLIAYQKWKMAKGIK